MGLNQQLWKPIGIIGSIASIISIALSIYFYAQTQEKRNPFFTADKIKSTIVDTKNLKNSPIIVSDSTGTRISNNLTLSNFYFWNTGKKAIKTENILSPLIISVSDSSEIIDFKVLNSSRNVCGVNLIRINKYQIAIDFRILEENDGFVGQLFYLNDNSKSLKLNGAIEGVQHFNAIPRSKSLFEGIFILLIIGFAITWILVNFLVIVYSFVLSTSKLRMFKENLEYNRALLLKGKTPALITLIGLAIFLVAYYTLSPVRDIDPEIPSLLLQ